MKTKTLFVVLLTLILMQNNFAQTPTKISKIVYDGVYFQSADLKYIESVATTPESYYFCWNLQYDGWKTNFPKIPIVVSSDTKPLSVTLVKDIKSIVFKGIEFTDGSQQIFISPAQKIFYAYFYKDNFNKAIQGPNLRLVNVYIPERNCCPGDPIKLTDEKGELIINQDNYNITKSLTIKKKSDAVNHILTVLIDDVVEKNKIYVIWANKTNGVGNYWFFKIVE